MKEQFELESLLRVGENPGNQAVYNLYCVRQKQEKPLLFKLTLRSRFTLSRAHSLLSWAKSRCQLLISNRTNHKLCKKLANQNRWYMSLRLCGIRKRYRSLECLRRRLVFPRATLLGKTYQNRKLVCASFPHSKQQRGASSLMMT